MNILHTIRKKIMPTIFKWIIIGIGVIVVIIAILGAMRASKLQQANSMLRQEINLQPVAQLSDHAMRNPLAAGNRKSSPATMEFAADADYEEAIGGAEFDDSVSLVSNRDLIQRVQLQVQVDDRSLYIDRVEFAVESAGGFVENLQRSGGEQGGRTDSMTIRVPSENLNTLVDIIVDEPVVLIHESRSTDDVTDQLVDNEARIANLEAAEAQYKALLSRTGEIEGVLEVQREIINTRNQIERLEAQQKNLRDKVSFSTISLTISSAVHPEVTGNKWRLGDSVKNSLNTFIGGIESIVEFIIDIVFRIPIILLWLAVFIAIIGFIGIVIKGLYVLFRRIRKKK